MSNKGAPIETLIAAESLPHVMVVDDDERLRALLSRFLQEHGFLVTTATDAGDARAKLSCFDVDLIVMDVMMPGMNGMELTRRLRAEDGVGVPVLLLTALEDVESRIEGFESGADDYLPKPFEPRELLLRINAILRRVAMRKESSGGPVRFGKWSFDPARAELNSDDDRQTLTQTEHALLAALVGRAGEAVTREELAKLCGMDAAERTIDVQVTRLRRKVEEDQRQPRHILTIRGKGYVFRAD